MMMMISLNVTQQNWNAVNKITEMRDSGLNLTPRLTTTFLFHKSIIMIPATVPIFILNFVKPLVTFERKLRNSLPPDMRKFLLIIFKRTLNCWIVLLDRFVGSFCYIVLLIVILDTFVGSFCWIVLLDCFVGSFCWIVLLDCFIELFVGLFCWIVLLGCFVGLFCWMVLFDRFVGSFCWIILLGRFVGLFCWIVLLDRFCWIVLLDRFCWIVLLDRFVGSFCWIVLGDCFGGLRCNKWITCIWCIIIFTVYRGYTHFFHATLQPLITCQ